MHTHKILIAAPSFHLDMPNGVQTSILKGRYIEGKRNQDQWGTWQGARIFATFSLPDGTTISNFKVFALDNDENYGISASLRQVDIRSTVEDSLGSVSTTGADSAIRIFEDSVPSSVGSPADNSIYFYLIQMTWQLPLDSWPDRMRVVAALIEYNLPNCP